MHWQNILLISTPFLVILGWFIVNHLSVKREHKSKNREIRYLYLSKAHNAFSAMAHREKKYTEQ